MSSSPTAVVLAAGQGTRMRSELPKVLHELCGRPLVLWPVLAAQEAGAGRVVVVDSPRRALAPVLPAGVELAVQEVPDGTGGAVIAAQSHIAREEPVLILSGDVPLLGAEQIGALLGAHARLGASATMATALLEDPRGYGRVVRGEDGSVERVVETKVAGDAQTAELEIHEVNSGIFVFDGRALLDALPKLRPDNAQGELYLPQVLELVRAAGGRVAAHPIDDPTALLGINDRVALAQVRAIAQRRINERHMLDGVTIVDPSHAEIDVEVRIGADARIEPDTQLRGATTVGARASVGPRTTAIDSHIGERACVRVAWLERARVGDGVQVGPFAYLRPGTVVREHGKVGTFVEVKNSTIGARTKVPHLSYIGDADVGEDSNLGASTITANYDGDAKHRTTIGSGVKGGVDTSLVAPVRVGDGAYTAAGSVITEDVPDGALGMARARQENIEGYARRRRERHAQPERPERPKHAPAPPPAA
ncbi:MAG: bifunctional UDP-N-acetylglucosamine diphosphorylase/glucosamine-1-phosphate N-acetyltransferase GlmU [Solirubrobacterales bacterium]|nr:bifunctional UDP-N-acetylglucosamine diphosphorylase/glucosamine-1-phosphate N-acetyltransferase GlmU [Solirubrobacterales bacterium]